MTAIYFLWVCFILVQGFVVGWYVGEMDLSIRKKLSLIIFNAVIVSPTAVWIFL